MKNIKQILNTSIALSIAFTSIQLFSQERSVSLGVKMTPEREAELLARINAQPKLTPEREAELLARSKAYVESMTEADKAKMQARIDSMTQEKATALGERLLSQDPDSYQKITPITEQTPTQSLSKEQQVAMLQEQLEQLTPAERDVLEQILRDKIAVLEQQAARAVVTPAIQPGATNPYARPAKTRSVAQQTQRGYNKPATRRSGVAQQSAEDRARAEQEKFRNNRSRRRVTTQ